jgi:hypothetical protein
LIDVCGLVTDIYHQYERDYYLLSVWERLLFIISMGEMIIKSSKHQSSSSDHSHTDDKMSVTSPQNSINFF